MMVNWNNLDTLNAYKSLAAKKDSVDLVTAYQWLAAWYSTMRQKLLMMQY